MSEKENKRIYRIVEKKNPFEVPDHYFDDVAREIVSKLPEKDIPTVPVVPFKPGRWTRLRPWAYAAAAFIGVILALRVVLAPEDSLNFEESAAMTQPLDADIISDADLRLVLYNAEIDDYALYEYLTDASGNE